MVKARMLVSSTGDWKARPRWAPMDIFWQSLFHCCHGPYILNIIVLDTIHINIISKVSKHRNIELSMYYTYGNRECVSPLAPVASPSFLCWHFWKVRCVKYRNRIDYSFVAVVFFVYRYRIELDSSSISNTNPYLCLRSAANLQTAVTLTTNFFHSHIRVAHTR